MVAVNTRNCYMRKYYGSMMVVCMRYTYDRDEARDVLHEGFMKVFRNLHKYSKGTNLGAWIRRIMINTSIDHYRKMAKRPNLVEINHAVHEIDVQDVCRICLQKRYWVWFKSFPPLTELSSTYM